MSDIARFNNPESLINRTVFDLDNIVTSKEIDKADSVSNTTPVPSRIKSAESLQAKAEKEAKRDTLIASQSSPDVFVLPDTADQSENAKNSAETTHMKEVPHLYFDSQIESGNLRKAVQVHSRCAKSNTRLRCFGYSVSLHTYVHVHCHMGYILY